MNKNPTSQNVIDAYSPDELLKMAEQHGGIKPNANARDHDAMLVSMGKETGRTR